MWSVGVSDKVGVFVFKFLPLEPWKETYHWFLDFSFPTCKMGVKPAPSQRCCGVNESCQSVAGRVSKFRWYCMQPEFPSRYCSEVCQSRSVTVTLQSSASLCESRAPSVGNEVSWALKKKGTFQHWSKLREDREERIKCRWTLEGRKDGRHPLLPSKSKPMAILLDRHTGQTHNRRTHIVRPGVWNVVHAAGAEAALGDKTWCKSHIYQPRGLGVLA